MTDVLAIGTPGPAGSSETTTRRRTADVLLAIAICSITLWDFRVWDIRIFDAVALACQLGFFLLAWEPLEGWLRRRRDVLLLIAIVILYALAGYVAYRHRSSLAIVILSLISLQLFGRRDWLSVFWLFRWLVIGHTIFFFIQFIGFYVFGQVVDFHIWLGTESRIGRSPIEIRAAGLFTEPNSYSLNLFLIATLAALHRRDRLLMLLAGTTMMLAQSLWGSVAAVVLIVLHEIRWSVSIGQTVKGCVVVVLVAVAIFNIYLWTTKQSDAALPYFYWRLTELADDASMKQRYIRSLCIEQPSADSEASRSKSSQVAGWIAGEGLTTRLFLQCLPANGIHFILKSFGALGSIGLLAGLWLATRGLPMRAKFLVAAALGFAFTTYPLVTYVIFWMWLPAMITLLRAEQQPPIGARAAEPVAAGGIVANRASADPSAPAR